MADGELGSGKSAGFNWVVERVWSSCLGVWNAKWPGIGEAGVGIKDVRIVVILGRCSAMVAM